MISVVIPHYNRKEYLRDCLDSLSAQTYRDFETIVVDDGSTDGSASFLKENYPWSRVVRLAKNRGFCVAANEGIKVSQGEYIALLNNDARAEAHWLEHLLRALEEKPEVGFCASKICFMDSPALINSAGIGMSLRGFPYEIGFGMEDGPCFSKPRLLFGACAGAAIYRKQMLEEVGLFDEDLYMFFEDVDLSFRAQLLGYKCLYVPEAVVYHRHGGTALHQSNSHTSLCCRNSIVVLMKNLPRGLAMKVLPPTGLLMVKHLLKRLLFHKDLAVFKGYGEGLSLWRNTLKKRSLIQRQKKASDQYIASLLDGPEEILWKPRLSS